MRSVMILAALAGVPACLFDSGYDDPGGFDDDDDGEPDPPDPPRPKGVDLGMDRKVAAGTSEHYARPFTLSAGTYEGVLLESSDPEMLEGYIIDENTLGFVTHGPGTYTLTARREGFSQILDTMTIFALPVEDIIFDQTFNPDTTETAITRFAAMAGGRVSVCATYFGPGRDRIPGHGAFEASGNLEILDDDAPGMDDIRSTCLDLAVGAVGPAELLASVEGGISRTLAVEIHPGPVTGELRFFAYRNGQVVEAQPMAGELVVARLIPRLANGEYLAGVIAAWTVGEVDPILATGEAMIFVAGESGTTMQVSATVGAQTFAGSVTVL